jgi:hypothetical protein
LANRALQHCLKSRDDATSRPSGDLNDIITAYPLHHPNLGALFLPERVDAKKFLIAKRLIL